MGEGTGGPGADRDGALKRELDAEIESHVAMRTEELVAAGMDPDEARREALRRFGDVEEARRALLATARRRERHRRWADRLEGLGRDIVHAFRRIRRAPGFSALAVGIFALGIGATTTMFSVTDHVLLRPLPFPHPEELVALGSQAEHGEPFYQVSMGNWADWRESPTLASTGLFAATEVTVTGEGDAFRAPAAEVSGAFFETLRPRMAVGRALTEDDGQRGEDVVVVSARLWRSVLGEPGLEGRTLEVDGAGCGWSAWSPGAPPSPERWTYGSPDPGDPASAECATTSTGGQWPGWPRVSRWKARARSCPAWPRGSARATRRGSTRGVSVSSLSTSWWRATRAGSCAS